MRLLWMSLAILLALEGHATETGDAGAEEGLPATVVMYRAVEKERHGGSYALALHMVHRTFDETPAANIPLEFAWNGEYDFELRFHDSTPAPPILACRGDLCVLDGRVRLERRWLQSGDMDYEAFSDDPELQWELFTASALLDMVADALLYPLTGFANTIDHWPYLQNEFVDDETRDGVYTVRTNPWSPAESRVLAEQGTGLRFVQDVDAGAFRLRRNRTIEDGVTLHDHAWEWAETEPGEEPAGLGLLSADFLVYIGGYPERYTFTVLSDRRIQPDEVFTDPGIFDIPGEVIAWPERARPIHRASLIHYIFPVLPYAAAVALAALIGFLFYRIRKRKTPQPHQAR